jgi:hypothetical protein
VFSQFQQLMVLLYILTLYYRISEHKCAEVWQGEVHYGFPLMMKKTISIPCCWAGFYRHKIPFPVIGHMPVVITTNGWQFDFWVFLLRIPVFPGYMVLGISG